MIMWVELETEHQNWKYCKVKMPTMQYGLTVYNTCRVFLLLLAPPDKMVAQAGTEPESDHALRDLLLDTCLNVLSS